MKDANRTFSILFLSITLTTPAEAAINLGNIAAGSTGSGRGGTITAPAISYPSGFKISSRTLQPDPSPLSTVSIEWTDDSAQDTSTVIERSTNGGDFVAIKTYPTPLDGLQSLADPDLGPDSDFCYRMTIHGPAEQILTTTPICALTQVRGDQGVWRTQLRVRIADVPDAGTDRRVAVWLTGPVGDDLPGGNWTGVKYAIDDFARGSDFTYDLSQRGVSSLHDITRIGIGTNYWDDPFCLSDLQLIVNGQVAFEKNWGNDANTCQWVAGPGPQAVVIDKNELRASPIFNAFISSSSFVVPGDELASRIESLVGSMFWERDDVDWREVSSGFGVQMTWKDGSTVHAKLPLKGVVNDGPDIDIDVDFDLDVGFEPSGNRWALVLEVVDLQVNVDFAWWTDFLSALLDPVCAPAVAIAEGENPFLDCVSRLEDSIAAQVKAGFTVSSQRINMALPPTCTTPGVFTNHDGGLTFFCAEEARTSVLNSRNGSGARAAARIDLQ